MNSAPNVLRTGDAYRARISPWLNATRGAIDYLPILNTRSLRAGTREWCSVLLSIALGIAFYGLATVDIRVEGQPGAATIPGIAAALMGLSLRLHSLIIEQFRARLSSRRALAYAVATNATVGVYLSIFLGQVIGVFVLNAEVNYLLPLVVGIVALGLLPAFVALSAFHILSNKDATLIGKRRA